MNKIGLVLIFIITTAFTNNKSNAFTEINMNRYGALCVANKLNCTVNYEYKWGKKGKWQSVCLRSGYNMTHTYSYSNGKCVSPEFHIRFDCDLSSNTRFEQYCLQKYASWSEECDDAYSYEFKKTSNFSNAFDLYDCEK